MRNQGTFSLEFKRQVIEELLSGESRPTKKVQPDYYFNMVFRKILKPTLRKIMTASAMKPIVYAIVPLKVRRIIARTAPASSHPMIVVG